MIYKIYLLLSPIICFILRRHKKFQLYKDGDIKNYMTQGKHLICMRCGKKLRYKNREIKAFYRGLK